jgi:hypothetical protein
VSQELTPATGRVSDLARANAALSWLFLVGFLIVIGIARGVYSANEVLPSARFESLVFVGFLTFVWYWIKQQCEPHGVTFPVDLAWFMAILWMFLAPYYLWRVQRWRGLAKFSVLVAGYVLSYVTSLAVHYTLGWLK